MSATKIKMGNSQKQNIAVQHAYFNRHGGRQVVRTLEPISFNTWFRQGIEKYQKKGFTFELLTPSLVRIKRPEQTNLLRTAADFVREYR